MTGTILNVITILVGGLLGLRFGKLLSEKARETIVIGLGLFTIGISVTMFLETNNSLIVLGGILIGGLLGEYLKIESRINKLGIILENRFNGGSQDTSAGGTFVRGFMTSSVLFITGPMAILGAIQDGLLGDYQLLAIKSIMDGFELFSENYRTAPMAAEIIIPVVKKTMRRLIGDFDVPTPATIME